MTTSFDWTSGYSSQRLPVFGRNVVSTSHPLAAQAGLHMLRRGGNAVDAAVATAAVMTVVEPVSNGLGSDSFCILWDGQQLHGLNASGRAPQAWTPDYFKRKYGADTAAPPTRGWDSATVPGAVASWVALSEKFGKLPFADLMAPAIEIAERGYAVPVVVQQKWAAAVPVLAEMPGFAQAFMPMGRAPEVGELFRFADGGTLAEADCRDPGCGLLRWRDRRGGRHAMPVSTAAASPWPTLRPTARNGSPPSARTTVATRCMRSRRTARALPR